MISRETIRVAEARTASHAAVFQIRAAAYDAIPADRPIARAIAAAELRRERAALAWSAERLATVRKYAAYEGIEGEDWPAIAPWTPEPIALDVPEEPATIATPPIELTAAEQTLERKQAAVDRAKAKLDAAEEESYIGAAPFRAVYNRAVTIRDRAAQAAMIQMKPAYGALLTEGYTLRQAESAGDAETIDACRRLYREAEARYNDLSAIANAAI